MGQITGIRWAGGAQFAVCSDWLVVVLVLFTWSVSSHQNVSVCNLSTHLQRIQLTHLTPHICSKVPSHKVAISYPLSQTKTV